MMATRKVSTKQTKTPSRAKETGLCKDCIHSGNRIEKDVNGEFFMCWCPFHRWSRFLRHDTCEHFELKKEDDAPDLLHEVRELP